MKKYYMERYRFLRRDAFFENTYAVLYSCFLFQRLYQAFDNFTNVSKYNAINLSLILKRVCRSSSSSSSSSRLKFFHHICFWKMLYDLQKKPVLNSLFIKVAHICFVREVSASVLYAKFVETLFLQTSKCLLLLKLEYNYLFQIKRVLLIGEPAYSYFQFFNYTLTCCSSSINVNFLLLSKKNSLVLFESYKKLYLSYICNGG